MTTSIVKPLKLPALASEPVRLFNALSLRGLRMSLKAGDSAVVLRWTQSIPAFEEALSVKVAINGDTWVAAFSSAEILRVHPLFADEEVAQTALQDLPQSLVTALCDVLLEPLLAGLSSVLDVDVRFLGLADANDRNLMPVLGGQLLWADRQGGMQKGFLRLMSVVGAPVDLADRLRHLPRQAQGFLSAVTDSLPFGLSVSAAEMMLNETDFAALSAGDVLLPEEWGPHAQKAQLTLTTPSGLHYEARADLVDGTITLNTPFECVTETNMQETDELEVRLTFELDRRTITVGELKSLEPGYVFKMTAASESPVTVLANGRPIARARLVDVGGVVGVQLTEKVPAGK